jgi:molybdopterin converting factor small subunit
MKVLYFAQAAVVAGCREEEWINTEIRSLEDFWVEAIRRHPGLSALRAQCRVAAGHQYVGPEDSLSGNAEVAVIPPVSGG